MVSMNMVTTLEITKDMIGRKTGVFLMSATISANSAKINPKTGIRQNNNDKKPIVQAKPDISFVFCVYSL